jgi:protein-disulfide isomerase
MQNNNQTLILAGSILLGFAFIAAAIFFSSGNNKNLVAPTAINNQGNIKPSGTPVRQDESLQRVYGNPDAKTTIVEFSDFECPFCARLHPTLKQVIDESDGNIKWEYRHLPLSIHATAEPAAIASECVADLKGNDTFWEYATALLSNQRGLTTEFLQSEAQKLGVEAESFNQCITDPKIASRVQDDAQTAIAWGGNGTPFNVIVFEDGTTKVASGALPYANWVQLLGSK